MRGFAVPGPRPMPCARSRLQAAAGRRSSGLPERSSKPNQTTHHDSPTSRQRPALPTCEHSPDRYPHQCPNPQLVPILIRSHRRHVPKQLRQRLGHIVSSNGAGPAPALGRLRARLPLTTVPSSPQGRIFQVEYAAEAVKQGSVVVGIASKTHAVLVAIKVRISHPTQPNEITNT